MDDNNLQQQIFNVIKRKTPGHLNVVDEIANVLGISADSAYRRMRGETTISLNELHNLCNHFRLSLDELMNIQTDNIIFQGQYLEKKTSGFETYMKGIVNTMTYMNSFKQREFFYMCKDLPFFHHYHLREIAAFKWFFWLKTYFEFPEFTKRKFRFSDYPDELFELDQKVLNLYNQIPSVEVWNIESMNIIFRQIKFYRDSEVFESDEDAYILYEAVDKLWDHLEKQAALGYKFNYGDPEQKPISELKMYFNEVLLGDNNMLVILDDKKMSFVTHSTINFMITRDLKFNENMHNHIQNQMRRSTLISEVSEKERSRFFRIIRDKITNRMQSLKV
jgi:transcriptional regulator with XRE-family HTH domain